jgi:uncharacterized protein (DUF1778 family)
MTRKLRKTERLTLRLTKDQRERLEKQAEKTGKRLSDMVRDLILTEIGRAAA